MNTRIRLLALVGLVTLLATVAGAQSRPRRVKSGTTTTTDTTAKKDDGGLLDVVPTDKDGQPATTRSRTAPAKTTNSTTRTPASNTSSTAPANDRPILTPKPSPNGTTANTQPAIPTQPTGPDILNGKALFEKGQFNESLKVARTLIAANDKDSDAWKLAGLSELNLKKYPDAVSDLEKTRDLQKAESKQDKIAEDGLAEAYFLNEQYDKALPLLTAATNRAGETPRPYLLQIRGVAELKGGKVDAAAATFAAAVKANPTDTISLFYLGKMAFEKKDYTGAIANFNRVTAINANDQAAWKYLIYSYLTRGQGASADAAKADADYLGAVRASEGLIKVNQDEDAQLLRGQALFYAKQYPQAIVALEKAATSPSVKGETLIFLAQ
ncbi:MAG: tetratricopeptide repeat protein, partial [Pyrinomonadaceae bacterium]